MESPRSRLFIAAPLEPADQSFLADSVEAIKTQTIAPGLRWVPAQNWHLTLRFLGDTDPEQQKQVERALEACVPAGPVKEILQKIGPFPGRRPVVLAAHLGTGPDLCRWAAMTEEAMRDCAFAPERRPFRGHITVARIQRGKRGPWPEQSIQREIRLTKLVLFRSDLTASGARYTALRSWPLHSHQQ